MRNLLDKIQYAFILHGAEMWHMLPTCTFLFINYKDVHSSSPLSSSSLSHIYLLFLTCHHFYPNSCACTDVYKWSFPCTTCDWNCLRPSLHFKPPVSSFINALLALCKIISRGLHVYIHRCDLSSITSRISPRGLFLDMTTLSNVVYHSQ